MLLFWVWVWLLFVLISEHRFKIELTLCPKWWWLWLWWLLVLLLFELDFFVEEFLVKGETKSWVWVGGGGGGGDDAFLFDFENVLLFSLRFVVVVNLVRLVIGLAAEKKDDVRIIFLSKNGLFSNSFKSRLVLIEEPSSSKLFWPRQST